MSQLIHYTDFDLDWFESIKVQKRNQGNPGANSKAKFLDIVTAFDIETTHIKAIEQSICYVWAWQFGLDYTVYGRTWNEFKDFVAMLKSRMKAGIKLVTFVHNLSYEFQFLKGIYDFQEEEVFAIAKRKVLKASMWDNFEMRCSYMHSNMSLKEYTNKMGAEHGKLSGEDFDYSIERYPWTELTEKEWAYIQNDVLGLVESIMIEMKHDEDNLYTLPLTSTGYVRRDAKKAMRQVSHMYVKKQLPNLQIYEMLREAFRGGRTHANRHYAGKVLYNVHSVDLSSSYSSRQCACDFPVSEFIHVGGMKFDDLMDLINVRKKAVIMRVSISNVRLIDPHWGFPYIPRDKCRSVYDAIIDNGRILEAEYIEITITDVDLKIILGQYDFDDFVAMEVAHARYGKLPQALIEETIHYFEAKTELKGIEEYELYYTKSKNKLNSIYGMMAQDPVKQSILFQNGEFIEQNDPIGVLLDKHNRKAFLPYQWGVWVTAWARYELEEGLQLAGDNATYCDTDSVKYLGEIDWSDYNNRKIEESKAAGSFATDPKGKTRYMGTFEYEGCYEEFSTLGAKKYVYRKDGLLITTIAGVAKHSKGTAKLIKTENGYIKDPDSKGRLSGGQELELAGGIHAFKPDFLFVEAGGTEAIYNDNPEIASYEVEGHIIPITSNVVLKDGTYTLGISAEYERLLLKSSKLFDI